MQATPEVLANQIVMAGDQARKHDRDTVTEAAGTLAHATKDIQKHVARAREAGLQNRWLWRGCLTAAGAGSFAGILLTIGVFHLVPEHGAAWILGLDRWRAGERLMASANSEAWSEIEYAASFLQDNRSTVLACKAVADRKKISQQCRIIVAPTTGTN